MSECPKSDTFLCPRNEDLALEGGMMTRGVLHCRLNLAQKLIQPWRYSNDTERSMTSGISSRSMAGALGWRKSALISNWS
jgi:hypothetical protein